MIKPCDFSSSLSLRMILYAMGTDIPIYSDTSAAFKKFFSAIILSSKFDEENKNTVQAFALHGRGCIRTWSTLAVVKISVEYPWKGMIEKIQWQLQRGFSAGRCWYHLLCAWEGSISLAQLYFLFPLFVSIHNMSHIHVYVNRKYACICYCVYAYSLENTCTCCIILLTLQFLCL